MSIIRFDARDLKLNMNSDGTFFLSASELNHSRQTTAAYNGATKLTTALGLAAARTYFRP